MLRSRPRRLWRRSRLRPRLDSRCYKAPAAFGHLLDPYRSERKLPRHGKAGTARDTRQSGLRPYLGGPHLVRRPGTMRATRVPRWRPALYAGGAAPTRQPNLLRARPLPHVVHLLDPTKREGYDRAHRRAALDIDKAGGRDISLE